jgi:hypothetical protein
VDALARGDDCRQRERVRGLHASCLEDGAGLEGRRPLELDPVDERPGPFFHPKNESDEPLGLGIQPLQAIDPSPMETLALEIGAHLLEIGLPGLLAEWGGAYSASGCSDEKAPHFLFQSRPEPLDLDCSDLELRTGRDPEMKNQVLPVADGLALDRDGGVAMALVLQILLDVDS